MRIDKIDTIEANKAVCSEIESINIYTHAKVISLENGTSISIEGKMSINGMLVNDETAIGFLRNIIGRNVKNIIVRKRNLVLILDGAEVEITEDDNYEVVSITPIGITA